MERLSAQEILTLYDEQLQYAQRIQQKIIPKPDTFNSSYYSFYSYLKPFRRVGGDFFDFKIFDDNSVSLILADATGHGIDAAMITTMVKLIYSHSLRLNSIQRSPSQILKEIDTEIEDILGFTFFSAFCLTLDPNFNRIYWSNAGHPPGFIIKQNKEVVRLNASLPLIGMHSMIDIEEYSDKSNGFYPGDKLILYTDGLTEAKNNKNEEYSADRVEELVKKYSSSSIDILCKVIINDQKEFTASTEANDDLCLLGIQYD